MARVNYTLIKSPAWMQSLFDMIQAEVLAHGSYSLVDTVNSPGGMPALVFKSSGSANPLNRDWYWVMARTTANPVSVYFAVAEGYDPSTKSLIRPAPGTNSASTVPASDSSYGGGAAYPIWSGTTGSTLNTADIRWLACTANNSYTGDSWVVVTRNGVWTNGNTTNRTTSFLFGSYVGWIEPLQSNDPGILVVGDYLGGGGASSPSMVSTRHPTVTTAGPYTWWWMAPSNSNATWTPTVGRVGGDGDRLYNARPVGGRRVLRTAFTTSSLQQYGDLRGLWPDLLSIPTVNGGATNDYVPPGDTMTIYDQAGVGSTYIYAFRAGSGGNELWINISAP